MARHLLWLILAGAALAAACSNVSAVADVGPEDNCNLETPGKLPRPPQRGLPCDLMPPGSQR